MTDYSHTVHVPKSKVPSRFDPSTAQNFAPRRPQSRPGAPFILMDGPPYANGPIHMGHAMNKLLKDTILKAKRALSQNAPALEMFWDCRGLPIEWAVEENLRKSKVEYSPASLMASCREFANGWVDTQAGQFQLLGVDGADWRRATTMARDATFTIMQTFHALMDRLYAAKRPVLWSHVERTSLAEAEVEEVARDVDTLWLLFPVVGRENAFVLVWTTTPWSLPANAALAFSPDVSYGWYAVDGKEIAVADDLSSSLENAVRLRDASSDELAGMRVNHALTEFEGERPLLPASYVTSSSGSGFVHVGPAHDVDDWNLWRAAGNETFPEPLQPNGKFADDTPLVGGMNAVKGKKLGDGNEALVQKVCETGAGWTETRTMTLKTSWQSGALLVSMATRQWFLRVDEQLRARIVEELHKVPFYPASSRNRMVSMVENRPDWLISRQRLWGTPMAILVNRETGEPLRDPVVLEKTLTLLSEESYPETSWREVEVEEILEDTSYDPEDYEKVLDVLDVWFDSACVPLLTTSPVADLVVEGSDQSRGWFQSLALVGMMLNDTLPYRAVITHGFVLNEKGEKMAKSKGNGYDPMEVVKEYGPDVLRLWVASSDVTRDIRFGKQMLATHNETFRKFRNTLRYLHGASTSNAPDKNAIGMFEDLELYMMERLRSVHEQLQDAMLTFDLTRYVAVIRDFCVSDLSQFYFEARKDALYCGFEHERHMVKACMTVLLHNMSAMLFPLMPYAVGEFMRGKGASLTVVIPNTPKPKLDWQHLRATRDKVQAMLEQNRAEYPTNLAAVVAVPPEDVGPEYAFGVSDVLVSTNLEPMHIVKMEDYHKCERCWRHLPLVENVCKRCHDVLIEVELRIGGKSRAL